MWTFKSAILESFQKWLLSIYRTMFWNENFNRRLEAQNNPLITTHLMSCLVQRRKLRRNSEKTWRPRKQTSFANSQSLSLIIITLALRQNYAVVSLLPLKEGLFFRAMSTNFLMNLMCNALRQLLFHHKLPFVSAPLLSWSKPANGMLRNLILLSPHQRTLIGWIKRCSAFHIPLWLLKGMFLVSSK